MYQLLFLLMNMTVKHMKMKKSGLRHNDSVSLQRMVNISFVIVSLTQFRTKMK